jgi:hypothetical protein
MRAFGLAGRAEGAIGGISIELHVTEQPVRFRRSCILGRCWFARSISPLRIGRVVSLVRVCLANHGIGGGCLVCHSSDCAIEPSDSGRSLRRR